MLGIRLHRRNLVVFLHNMAAEVVLASVLSSTLKRELVGIMSIRQKER